jgi:hypothetical protein
MSIEIRVDAYPVFEEDRFIYRHVSKIVNEGLKEFNAEWSVDKRIIYATKRSIDDSAIEDIFDALYHKAWKSVNNWKRKLDNIVGCLFIGLYGLLSLFFVEAYNQTHGFVVFGIFVLGMAFLYIPWWYFHFQEMVLPLLQEQFPLKLEQ